MTIAINQKVGTNPRRRIWARWFLAGVVVSAVSVLIVAAMPLWLPGGVAGIDHLVIPLIVLPAVWAILFFHAVLDRSLVRVLVVNLVLGVGHAALLAKHFTDEYPAVKDAQVTP